MSKKEDTRSVGNGKFTPEAIMQAAADNGVTQTVGPINDVHFVQTVGLLNNEPVKTEYVETAKLDKSLHDCRLKVNEPVPAIDPILRAMIDDGIVLDGPVTDGQLTTQGRINWESLFNKEYLVYPGNDQSKKPLLKVDGLRDLAEVRGVESKEVTFQAISDTMVVCSVKMKFRPNRDDPDGRTWSAVADATPANVGGKGFSKYLATIAETRATGRCIREALGIRLCTVEEVCKDDLEYDDTDEKLISDMTISAIKRQLTVKGITESSMMEKITKKYPHVTGFNQLTVKQGRDFLKYLNELENKKAEATQ